MESDIVEMKDMLKKHIAYEQSKDQLTNESEYMTDKVNVHNHGGAGADQNAMLAAALMGKGGGGDGLFGSGGGGGLLGGVLLASLLGRGNLLGGAGGVNDVIQPAANMSIMNALGDIKTSVALGTQAIDSNNAAQTNTLLTVLSNQQSAVLSSVGAVKDSVTAGSVLTMQGTNQVMQAISTDGEKTRQLLVQQYEATLNRQLSDANAQIVELRSDQRSAERARDVEVNVTQNVNQQQMQQQMQQQVQSLNATIGLLAAQMQNIRSENQAINIGSGRLQANPTNTNSNVYA